jgi:hypothetical protein
MAWKKITLSEAENLRCDISNDDIHAAVRELGYQLGEAGIVLPKKTVNHKVFLGVKPISKRAVSSKSSSSEKSLPKTVSDTRASTVR